MTPQHLQSQHPQGHTAPLRQLIPPTALSPLLVSSDENEVLILWEVNPQNPAATPREVLRFALDESLESLHRAHWCQQVPYRLWCMDSYGQVGYYPLDLNTGDSPRFQACALPLSDADTALDLLPAQHTLLALTSAGLFFRELNVSSESPWQSAGALPVSSAEQAHGVYLPTEHKLVLALQNEKVWQVFEAQLPPHSALQWTALSPPQTQDTVSSQTQDDEPAFFLSPTGRYLVRNRQVHDLQNLESRAQTYYGRPLAFSAQQPRLLWASGDSLFLTDFAQQGSITHHQPLSYHARFATWPIFWSLAAAQPLLPESQGTNPPEFWVADHHRHNASALWAAPTGEGFTLGQSLTGEGGWVESLCFLENDTLMVGGGQKGSLYRLHLQPNQASLTQGFETTSQPIDNLVLASADTKSPLVAALQGAQPSIYPLVETETLTAPLAIQAPAAPWHKALQNGALSQWITGQGADTWIAQFEHKGKYSLQAYQQHTQSWRELSKKWPEQAVLIAALSPRYFVFEAPGRESCLQLFDAVQQSWQKIPCALPWIDQAQWQVQTGLLVLRCENSLQVYVFNENASPLLQPLPVVEQTALFNGLRLSAQYPHFWTLDNDGQRKHWQVDIAKGHVSCAQQYPLTNWDTSFHDRVVAISENANYVALGDRDLPLHIWDRQGHLLYTCLVCLNDAGTAINFSCT